MHHKRRFNRTYVLSIVLLLLAVFIQGVAYAAEIAVYVNGQAIAFPLVGPQLKDGRVLLPLRITGEAVGATADWDEASGTITAVRGANKVVMTTGSSQALVNGTPVNLAVPPEITEGVTLVPVRFFGESLGVTVAWDDSRNAVIIGSAGDGSGQTSITVNGSATFRDKVGSALELLAATAPGHYREVSLYLTAISEGEHSGVDVVQRNFIIGRGTAKTADLFWLASIIVHDAHHTRMYAEGRVFAGEAAERECIEVQKTALLAMAAPEYYIEHLNQVIETAYWEVPYGDRNW